MKIKATISLVFVLIFILHANIGFSQTLVWSEDFSSYADPSGKKILSSGIIDVGDYPASVSKWTLDMGSIVTDGNTDWFYATGGAFSAKDLDGVATWTSESISIVGYSNIKLSVDLFEDGTMESSDYFKVYYKIDGGTKTQFSVNGYVNDDFTSATAEQTGLSGNSVVIIIECANNADDEIHTFDNVKVQEMTSNSSQSDIVKTPSWSEPTNISYSTYSATTGLTTSNSIEVASFTIRDGGTTTDADAVATKLTALDFSVGNYNNIAAIAIFDGTSNIAEETSVGSTVSFSGLNLQAADGSTKVFTLRATFKSSVTDNVNLQYSISSATADLSGSSFAAADAGGAETDNTGNNNKLVVSADRLAFSTNKPPATVHISSNFDVEVKAVDANNNVDLDASNSITLIRASGTGTLSSATGLIQSLVAGVYTWNDVQYDVGEVFTIEAQATSLTNVTSHNIISSIRAWINEFHYDDISTDEGEFVEVCIQNASSYTLSDFTVTLYNGSNGTSYNTKTVDLFTEGTTYNDVTVYYYVYPTNGIQNDKDGIAISYNGTLLEFISYEGSFTATNGVANGETSHDVGVSENGSTPAGTSIGRVGVNDEWSWEAGNAETKGTENNKSDGSNQILPIQLISFYAKSINKTIELNWQTATETNNDYFTIERSLDAEYFEVIGKVRGAGSSNIVNAYAFVDDYSLKANVVYYRLKQTDYDGSFTYSKIISVNTNTDELSVLKTYQEAGNLNINVSSTDFATVNMEVYNLNGQLVINKNAELHKGQNNIQLDISTLPQAVYLIQFISDGFIKTQKIFIQ